MDLQRAFKILEKIRYNISELEDSWGHMPDEFTFDYDNQEERYKNDIAIAMTNKLDEIKTLYDWINTPISHQGSLVKNFNDRYEVQGIELTSGSRVEVWSEEDERWYLSRVEHSGGDYYITVLGREVPIEGVKVRLRR